MVRKEFYLIYFCEFTARFCTWVIISQLLMHLLAMHWQTSSQQLYMVGASLSLLFISAIFGGIIRDWLGSGKLVVITGIGLIVVGGICLFSASSLFYVGLSLSLFGAGMVPPTTPLLLFSLINAEKVSDKSFTILYGVTNAGVILGAILGGIVHEYCGWHGVIILTEVIALTCLGYCILDGWFAAWKELTSTKLMQLAVALSISAAIAYSYLKFERVSAILLVIAGLVYLFFLGFLICHYFEIRKLLMRAIFFTVVAILFFSGEFQVASTLVNYTHAFVKLNVGPVTIPVGSLLAFEAIFVVLGAFFITRIKFFSAVTRVQTKLLVGLALGVLAFVVLYVSTLFSVTHLIGVLWIVLAFLLLGLGDVYLMPPIMAYVTEIAPPNYKGRLMAGMYFALSIAGYLSGFIGAKLSSHFIHAATNIYFYRTGFGMMVLLLSFTVVGVILLNKLVE